MNIKQIATLLGTVTEEILGSSEIVTEDLQNVVDIGTAILSATSYDHYVKTLVNHIGKVMFVDRPYGGGAPSVFRDSWEYGAILKKVSFDLPDATDNSAWNLTDGTSYADEEHTFHKPAVSVKFFSDRTTYNIPISITERQVKESFSSVNQLNGFISGIYNAVENAITVKNDSLVMRTINNMIAETLYNADSTGKFGNNSFVRAVNVLKLYNDKFHKTLTAAESINDPDFIRFASTDTFVYNSETKTSNGNNSSTSSGTGKNTVHSEVKGNIGVTTTQQMLTSEIELRRFNLINEIYNDLDTILTIGIYVY